MKSRPETGSTEKPKKQKHEHIDLLLKREGTYMGMGTNHEEKEFRGEMKIRTIVNNKGISIRYKCVGMEGVEFNKDTMLYNKDTVLYNEEYTIVCNDSDNELCLFTLNSNVNTMAKFELRRFRHVSASHQLYIFGFGDPEDKNHFREEITIELWEDGDISYNYSWGEAGGIFLSRSTIRMKKIG